MRHWSFWAGLILVLVALLPAIGLTFGVIPVFAGSLLVIIAILGGYLLRGHAGMSHGWELWAAIILVLLALLPTIGFVIVPALVFTGPLLVIVAALGGYLLAKPSHGHGI